MDDDRSPIYQQGDLLFEPIPAHEDRIEARYGIARTHPDDKPLVILPGERTGHNHAIRTFGPGVSVQVVRPSWQWSNLDNRSSDLPTAGPPTALIVKNEPVIITHEEHQPLVLPPGRYAVRQVREFDPFAGQARNVAD